MGAHAASSADAPFNRRGVPGRVIQLLQDTLDAPLGAVRVANIDLDHMLALPMFHDLYMGQRARNAVTHVRKAPTVSLTAGVVGLSVGEQDHLMPIDTALGRIL